MPVITRPARNSAEKWDALLYRKKLDGDTQERDFTRVWIGFLTTLLTRHNVILNCFMKVLFLSSQSKAGESGPSCMTTIGKEHFGLLIFLISFTSMIVWYNVYHIGCFVT